MGGGRWHLELRHVPASQVIAGGGSECHPGKEPIVKYDVEAERTTHGRSRPARGGRSVTRKWVVSAGIAAAVVVGAAVAPAGAEGPGSGHGHRSSQNEFVQTNLVS